MSEIKSKEDVIRESDFPNDRRMRLIKHWLDDVEQLDTDPIALPLGHELPESLESQIKRLVASEVRAQHLLESGQLETPEEANDFEIGPGDEVDLFDTSPYELSEEENSETPPIETPSEPIAEAPTEPPAEPPAAPPTEPPPSE